MLLQGQRRRTGVACDGYNAEVVVKRERLTSTEHYQDEIRRDMQQALERLKTQLQIWRKNSEKRSKFVIFGHY